LNGAEVPANTSVVVAPAGLHVLTVKDGLKNASVEVATQNVHTTKGAFTGELNPAMVADAGIKWTLLGHSERRHVFGETDAGLTEKVTTCMGAGLSVIFCIGELLADREAGKTNDVCATQLDALIAGKPDWAKIVIAYEPVWAIGTGVVASPEQAQEAHAFCRSYLAEKVSKEVADDMRIQYGGSVSAKNCQELAACADIDGFLVGGASLKPEFADIIKAFVGVSGYD